MASFVILTIVLLNKGAFAKKKPVFRVYGQVNSNWQADFGVCPIGKQ